MTSRASVLWAAALCAACATTSQQSPEQTASQQQTSGELPPEVQQALDREIEPLPVKEVASGDGAVKARVEASGAPAIQPQDDFHLVVVPLEDTQLQCYVYGERLDPATSLKSFADTTLQQVGTHTVKRLHAGAEDGWPHVIAEVLYKAEREGQELLGHVKYAVTVRDETTSLCVLDAPGLSETFERVVSGFFASLDTAANRATKKPKYRELVIMQAGDALAGFSDVVLRRDKAGMLNEQSFETTVARGQDGTLQAVDEATLRRSRAGKIIEGTFVAVKDGETTYELQLQKQGPNYTASGTFHGKPVDASFQLSGGLPDLRRQMKMTARFVARGREESLTFDIYSPGLDPTKPLQLTMAKQGDLEPPYNAVVRMGSLEMRAAIDQAGSMQAARMQMGPMTMEMQRVWARGKL